jgi:hypothetical protein
MAKDVRYKTVYFADTSLLDDIEAWMNKNKVEVFNMAIVKLIGIGLGRGEKESSPLQDKHIRTIVREELQKLQKESTYGH